jgi:hypothetical protein
VAALAPPDVDPSAWEVATDPEGAFTVQVPRGWRRSLGVARNGASVREIIRLQGPDAEMFVGDPNLPVFVEPGGWPPAGAVIRPYTSIERLLPEYAHGAYAGRPGYRPVGIQPEPALYQFHQQRLAAAGLPGGATAARLRFDHDGGATVLLGAAVSLGPIWSFDVAGATARTPDDWVPALLAVMASRRTTPTMQQRFDSERAASAAAHQATMAQIQQQTSFMAQQHAARMQDLHASAAAHQSRMTDLHASFDAANAAWADRQASLDTSPTSSDAGHRAFVEAIAGERTVVGPGGDAVRVPDGYDRYFRNRHDGSWVGLRAHEDLSDALRGTGVDPSYYDEWSVRR